MFENTLITLLNSLDKEEIKEFGLFLESPYFNKNNNVKKLFNFIINTDDEKRRALTNKLLHHHVFGETEFSNENIKTLIYILSRLCEKFLVISSFENEKDEFERKLLSIFDERGLDKLFIKNLKRNEKVKPAETKLELNYIYKRTEYEKTVLEFYSKRDIESKVYEHEHKLSDNLIAAFMVDMFKQYNLFWRLSYLGNVTFTELTTSFLKNIDMDNIFAVFEENGYQYKNLLLPYYEIFRMLNNDDADPDFEIFKNRILNNNDINDNEKFILSTILVNTFYYKNLKSGNRYTRELFESFRLLLLLYKHSREEYLRYTIFSNVIRYGLQLGEYDWTENFIRKSHVLLEPSIKENMFYYSSAYLSFAKKDFEKCLEFESKINYENFQQRYYLRDLRLCSLFELGKYETALNLVDSYKHFIKNDRSYTAKMKKGYLLFLGFINDLIRLKLGISKKNPYEVKEKLKNSVPVRKEWLNQKFLEI